ncbi:hypothetical protein V1512DRAFT_263380 [Lipomyces arxii]|uniref:uncharacterized protein n=1 Tax=Lipomyces arxii TaxID=56418 RepID=UPI0034CFD283
MHETKQETTELLASLFTRDSKPEAIIPASFQRPAVLIEVLDKTTGHAQICNDIILASTIFTAISVLSSELQLQSCAYTWDDLSTDEDIAQLEQLCICFYAKLHEHDISHIKRSVQLIKTVSDDFEALLAAILFNILQILMDTENCIERYLCRAEVARLHLLIQMEITTLTSLGSSDSSEAMHSIEEILDGMLDISLEPFPGKWIEEVEHLKVQKLQYNPTIKALESSEDLTDALQAAQEQLVVVSLKQSDHVSTDDSTINQMSYRDSIDGNLSDFTDDSLWLSGESRCSSTATTNSPSQINLNVRRILEGKDICRGTNLATPLHRIGSTPRLVSPIGTLENTDYGLVVDINRLSSSANFSPLFHADIHSNLANEADVDKRIYDELSVDEESPHPGNKGLPSTILEKDKYMGHNVLPGSRKIKEPTLDMNDPKRSSVDVSTLRNGLATTSLKTSGDRESSSSVQHSLDVKIQNILTDFPEGVMLVPSKPDKKESASLGVIKLAATSTGSTLKEMGYGQTCKYILQRPNASPQTIWVRIVAERVMVRVGGGWTDLADWLSNYILHHSPTSADNSTSFKRRSASNRTNVVNNASTSAKQSGAMESDKSLFALGRQCMGGSPTPLGMAGPISSFEQGRMSEDERVWVQHMLQQVENFDQSKSLDDKHDHPRRKLFNR